MSGPSARRRRLALLVDAAPVVSDADLDGRGDVPAGRSLRELLARLCHVAVRELGVDGAGVTLMGSVTAGRDGHRVQLWGTGRITERLEDLQLTAGQGPCLEAYATGRPVLVADLLTDGGRWLGFTPDAVALGVRALFSLPLQVGAAGLGTLDLHREEPGPLSSDELADGTVLATLATEAVLDVAAPVVGRLAATGGWLPDAHADVHQASGMVAAREGIAVGPALLRVRAYAFGHDLPIAEVARRVLARELVLPHRPSPLPPATP